MADYHQIADQIRAFVQSSDQTRSEVLEGLASAYAEACVELNQRIGRCHRLLQQGLRSEAIQLAESDPKLLDSLAALDFPERADWDELVQIYELAAAPKLSVDQAQFLNEAYAQEDPLQDLLRMHRRLALQRAPLKSRIAVMRKLAAQDANNVIWTDDLRTFEKARFREVQVEAAQAVQSRSLTALGQLLAEIEQQSWVESPPRVLVQGLRKADAQFRGQQTRALLTDLDARLNDAFAARDPIRGRLARQEWIKLSAAAPPEPDDPIWDRVGSALVWLEGQDRRDEADHAHEEALTALVHALDDPVSIPPAALERLAHAVLQYGRGMPEGIQLRYVARLHSAEAAQARRWRVIAGGAAAVILLIGSLAFYSIRTWTRAGDAVQAATAIGDMLELGEVDQAVSLLAKLEKADAGLLAYAPLVEARQRLQVAQDKETDRILQFDEMMRAVEQAPVIQRNPAELETARKLARHDTEKQAIEELIKRRMATLQGEQARHDKDVGPRLDVVGRKLAELEQQVEIDAGGKTDDPKILGLFADAQRTLIDVGPELPYVGDNLQSLASAFDQKLDALRGRIDQRQQKVRLEGEMTGAVAYSAIGRTGNLVSFANGLDTYVKSLPNDPRSLAFRRTREEQQLWYSVEAWNTLVTGWKVQPNGLTVEEAKLRAELCRRFMSQCPEFPGIAEIARYQRHAEAIARRASGPESPASRLQLLLSDIFVNHVWMVTTKENTDVNGKSIIKHYYTTKEPQKKGNYSQFFSIVSFAGKELARSIHSDRITYLGLSPQSKIASQFKPIVADESKLTQWETVMMDLVEAILRQPDIDPILQVALLRQVVGAAVEGSEALRESLATIKNQLDQATVDVNVPWMNPETPRLNQDRTDARFLIQSLPELTSSRKQALARRDQIERGVAHSYQTVGWLVRNADGWHVRSDVAVLPQRDLWVIVYREDKSGEWKRIGTITDGKPKIHTWENSALAEGRPVFVIASSF